MTTLHEIKKIKQGYDFIVGCDEVGRGCLAGPVVAAAVVFKDVKRQPWFKHVRDSKQLLPPKRKILAKIIRENAWWGIGMVGERKIDEINIHHATLLAMKQAVENLLCHCEEVRALSDRRGNLIEEKDCFRCTRNDKGFFLYVDGKFPIPQLNFQQEAVVDGDNKILSVAAASIVAKVYRDGLMRRLHKRYPVYNFARHKGYATLQHRRMILRHGLSQIHRLSFCGQFMS